MLQQVHTRYVAMKQRHPKDPFFSSYNSCVADIPVWDYSRASCTLLHVCPELRTRSLVAPCIVALLSYALSYCDLSGRGLHIINTSILIFLTNFMCSDALIWNEHGWELYYSHVFRLVSASYDISIESCVIIGTMHVTPNPWPVINRRAHAFETTRKIPGRQKLFYRFICWGGHGGRSQYASRFW